MKLHDFCTFSIWVEFHQSIALPMIPKGNKGCDTTPFQELSIADNSSTHAKSSDSYPLGVSYLPLSDYATSVQQNQNFQFFKRDIYQCFLSVRTYMIVLI